MTRSVEERCSVPACTLLALEDLQVEMPSGARKPFDQQMIDECTRLFDHNGMLVLEDVLPKKMVEISKSQADEIMTYLQEKFKEKGVDMTEPFRFKEVCRRQYNRFDVKTDLLFSQLYGEDHCNAVGLEDKIMSFCAPWLPLLKSMFQTGDFYAFRRGIVYNEGGSGSQNFHSDGSHLFPTHTNVPDLPPHCIHLFFPLVDLLEEHGGTELLPGSHKQSAEQQTIDIMKQIDEDGCKDKSTTPLLKKGSVLFFDYRLVHRGTPNITPDTSRPLAYITYARKWFGDDKNFGDVSLLDYEYSDPFAMNRYKP